MEQKCGSQGVCASWRCLQARCHRPGTVWELGGELGDGRALTWRGCAGCCSCWRLRAARGTSRRRPRSLCLPPSTRARCSRPTPPPPPASRCGRFGTTCRTPRSVRRVHVSCAGRSFLTPTRSLVKTGCVKTSTVTLNWCASHVTHLRCVRRVHFTPQQLSSLQLLRLHSDQGRRITGAGGCQRFHGAGEQPEGAAGSAVQTSNAPLDVLAGA